MRKHMWAFKYADQKEEAALLVVSHNIHRFRNRTVSRCAKKYTGRPLTMVEINETEWLMWEAFNLCPIVEIFANKDDDGNRVVEYHELKDV